MDKRTIHSEFNSIFELGSRVLESWGQDAYTPALSDEIVSFTDATGNVIRSTVVPKEILHFVSSGYEVVREWMKYHSYAYYRKACCKEDFEDLFNLLGRIQDFKRQVVLADIQMKQILDGQFITPVR